MKYKICGAVFLIALLLEGCAYYEHSLMCDSSGCWEYHSKFPKSSNKRGYTPFPEGHFKWVPGHPDCYKYGKCLK